MLKKGINIIYYQFNNTVIGRTHSTQDLGLQFDLKLTFLKHTILTVSKAYKIYRFFHGNGRNFSFLRSLQAFT